MKKRGSSVNLDIHHSKVFSSGCILPSVLNHNGLANKNYFLFLLKLKSFSHYNRFSYEILSNIYQIHINVYRHFFNACFKISYNILMRFCQSSLKFYHCIMRFMHEILTNFKEFFENFMKFYQNLLKFDHSFIRFYQRLMICYT